MQDLEDGNVEYQVGEMEQMKKEENKHFFILDWFRGLNLSVPVLFVLWLRISKSLAFALSLAWSFNAWLLGWLYFQKTKD